MERMYQERARELAEQFYNRDFHDLDEDLQVELYEQAMENVHDKLAENPDFLGESSEEVNLIARIFASG